MAARAVPAVRDLPCRQISRITLPESLTWARSTAKTVLPCLPACRPFGGRFVSITGGGALPSAGPGCHSLRSWHRRQGDTFDRNVRFNDRLSQARGVSSARHTRAPTPATKAAFFSSPTLSTRAPWYNCLKPLHLSLFNTNRYRYRLPSLLSCLTTFLAFKTAEYPAPGFFVALPKRSLYFELSSRF